MSAKDDLAGLLHGTIPATPPHWELDFQIQEELFGLTADDDLAPDDHAAFRLDVERRLIDEYDWAAVPGKWQVADIARTKAALGSDALVPAFDGGGVFWMPTGEDMMDFTIRLYEHPADLHAQARQKCENAKEFYAQAVDAGADFFVLTYDFGYNDGPFVSPGQFADLCAPYMTELVACIHDLGKKVLLHSDGCIAQILDQIHATGVDGYQSVDPQGHMDIKVVRERNPDWLLMGNVACNMLQDTLEEKIQESVRYCLEHGGVGKPYIFSTSNCIFAGMPAASYRIMMAEYRRICAAARVTGHVGA